MQIKPIAYIDSCYKDRFAIPRQSLLVKKAEAFIRFEAWIQPELALQGLNDFSHLWVIFAFHLNKEGRYHAKVHPPRLEGASIGVFATRSPHRPNPLGLSLVEIKNITPEGIDILGGDLADGTPVYDVKPYLPEVECLADARGGWSSKAANLQLPVQLVSPELELKLQSWADKIQKPNLREIIFETLARDPRPLVYKSEKKNYKEVHAFRVFNGDVHFTFENGVVVILDFLI